MIDTFSTCIARWCSELVTLEVGAAMAAAGGMLIFVDAAGTTYLSGLASVVNVPDKNSANQLDEESKARPFAPEDSHPPAVRQWQVGY